MDNFKIAGRPTGPRRPTMDGFVNRAAASVPVTGRPVRRPTATRPAATAKRPVSTPVVAQTQLVAQPSSEAAPSPVAKARVTSAATGKLPKLDLNLDETPAAARPANRLNARKAFRKWLLRGGLATLVLLVVVGGLLFAQGYVKLHKVFKGGATHAAALTKNVSPTLLKGEGDGRVNILLLGNGGDGHDGPDLTDTMMVASIDPVNNTATLLSVPRDLWVKMPTNFVSSSQKINAAYESGKYSYLGKIDSSNANTQAVDAGFKSADQVVSQVLGITIHYNMVVDFSAFRQAVDAVNGITVNVSQQLYDPTMAWENNHNPVLAAAGVQQMNGVQALLYARSRETTSDFARGERQRAIILALKQKALTAGVLSNPLKISQLMSAFGNNMVTDVSLSDAVRMYDLTKNISTNNVKSLDLVTDPNSFITTANLNGISIDEPKAGLNSYGAIQTFVRTNLRDGYLAKENAQVEVLNGTSEAGLATTKATELKSYGYNVTKVDTAPTQTYSKTIVVDLTNGTDKYTRHYLETRYGVSAVAKLPDSTIQPNGANFVIILGQDQE